MKTINLSPKRASRYFQERTYIVKPHGKKFETEHYVDGVSTGSLISKNNIMAEKKGARHLKNYVNY